MTTLYASIKTTEGTINARYCPDTNKIFAVIGDYCHTEWHPQSGEAKYVNNSATGYGDDKHRLALIDSAWWDKQEPEILRELFSPWRKY